MLSRPRNIIFMYNYCGCGSLSTVEGNHETRRRVSCRGFQRKRLLYGLLCIYFR